MRAPSSTISTQIGTEDLDVPRFEAEVRQRYAAIRFGVADGTPITVLHIGDHQTAYANGRGAEAEVVLTLDIGSVTTASDFFKHSSPTAGELEHAIAAVEGALIRARELSASNSKLFTMDAAIRAIAVVAGMPDTSQILLGVEDTERTFDRLVSVASGRPRSQEGLPASNAFAVTLLILRESMHHLRFSSITVVD